MTGAALDRVLTERASDGGLLDLAAAWQADVVKIVLPGMAGFASSPSLGNKVRGALGVVLLESASEAVKNRLPCTWEPACTAEIFFGRRPVVALGGHSSEIGKPFVLSTRAKRNGSLQIAIRILGLARDRTPAVADALVRALRDHVRWQDLAKDGFCVVPKGIEPSLVSSKTETISTADMCPPMQAELVFLTPLDAERGNVAKEPHRVIEKIVRRVALIAPWNGITLRGNYSELIESASQVRVEHVDRDSVPSTFAGGHRMVNQLVAAPHLKISGPLDRLWPALVIGKRVHVGRGANLGLGRYRLYEGAENGSDVA